MKTSTVLALWLAAVATGSPLALEKRQLSMLSSMFGMIPSSYKIAPSSIKELKPKLRENAVRKVARYGPFVLPANKEPIAKPAGGGHSHGGGSEAPGMAAPKPAAEMSGWDFIKQAVSTLLALKPMDPNGFSTMRLLEQGAMCTNCTVLAGKMSVVFENGTNANIGSGVYLHHAIAIDVSKNFEGFVTMCPPAMMGGKVIKGGGINTFIGGAVDDFTQLYTTPDGSFKSGYYIKDNNFAMQAEMINYLPTEQKVYVQTDLEWVPGKVGGDAEHGVLSVMGCDGKFAPWKPEKNTTGQVGTDGFEIYRDGHIILARGHMHDGGTGVNMYVNGKLYCKSKAIYGGPGGTITLEGKTWATIATMTECNDPIPVKKGDKLKIEATYDTKEHPLRESHGEEQENMGIMTMVFAPLE